MSLTYKDGLIKKVAVINLVKMLIISFLLFLAFYILLSLIAKGEGIAILSLIIPVCISVVFSIVNLISIVNIKSIIKDDNRWKSAESEFLKIEMKDRQVIEEKIRKNLLKFEFYEEKNPLKTTWIGVSSLNFKSFGEVVLITLEQEQRDIMNLRVLSMPVVPFTMIDWGKNKQNLKKILSI